MTEQTRIWYGSGLALLLHAGLAAALLVVPMLPERKRTVVEFEVRKPKPPPPPIKQPEPEPPKPPPEPERRIVKQPKPSTSPKPAPEQPPPKEAPPPVFGLDQKDTVGQGIAVPQGNTTLADPSKRKDGPIAPLPPAGGAPGKEYNPVAEVSLKRLPQQDNPACGAAIKEKYEKSPAFAEGIEGEVMFRIELDESGKIRTIKRIKGLGHGLDELAMGYLRFNPACRFQPAIAKDGKPAAFVIERYTFIFELPH